MQPLQKLIELATEALSLYIRKTSAELGETLPLPPTPKEEKDKPARRPRAAKEPVEAAATAPVKSPFEIGGDVPLAANIKLSPEEAAEAKKRCQEVMVAFIRRFKDAKPSGAQRAQDIVKEACGRVVTTFEALTPEDHVKLVPAFEAELDKAV